MRIAVGSLNPAKIEAVREAFADMWPRETWIVESVAVPSGVSDQPMSDEESVRGARNRAENALRALEADFAVGLEGGIQRIDGQYYDCGWAVVIDKEGFEGVGSSVRMRVPEAIMERIGQGEELGSAIDRIFGTDNAKEKEGHFGLMTNNRITRAEGYKDGVLSALGCFLHKELFTSAAVAS